MIAEAGLAAIWLAASMALLQFIAGLTLLRAGAGQLAPLIKPAAYMQGALCTFAFFALMWLFYITDLSVLLVANNSHIDKPLIFKLAGTWGNHEGSMLLWVTILAVSGAAIAFLEKRIEAKTLSATLAVQGFLALGFFAFLLFSSNPFERMVPAPIEGAGLNPLLQDVGLAFHPPTLYFGYVGLSIAFSFAVGALLTNQVGPAFARAMRPWVLGAWIFLTIGIAAGSYWAYYELGWGGWWFWDPVENASLMPWLAATALLHSVSVLATRNALRAWTVMLALVAFAMSMAGTFLVRSGILTSVHAFAVDPERGSFILALMLMYTGLAFVIFALRIGTVKQGEPFQLLSREGGIVANNVFLSVILAVILIGTLYPIAVEALGDKISVGPPYFNKATVPIAVLLMLALLVGPLLRWRRDGLGRLKYWLIGAAAILLLSCLAIWKFAPEIGIFPLLGIALSSALAVAAWMPLRGRKLLRTPIPVFGMVIAHFGLAVSVFGMAAESGFSSETLTALAPGESAKVAGWEVKLNDVNPVVGDNWVAVEGEMIAAKNGNEFALHPQSRQFFKPPMQTSEAALLTRWNGQLYVVIAQPDQEGDGRWQVRLWWKPFVTFIWYGAILIALGGAIALLGRMGRRTKKPATNTWQTE
ncbi:MAG: heme lyase CcmF/NrfE family subunit [Sphingorhabdus sp.]|jgi:cytochrome c-type biogenesis protein CcmF|uniref:heme lyase CcmF/NrfE family subunit n=3 Tax=Sphingorhabdus sp. TaxID=1902408 RepID=UPI00273D4218|nr:heme lyase CcmF/NrfE family subunit [Sphingorhabdus sp.]MDP4872469.1 heme lyase CcmF/NrfE family subunit [Sphingorhabdus sp.]MDP4926453.1 heme lyase CcmF/NrfE family subunit [Sphingorhabdus sp.]